MEVDVLLSVCLQAMRNVTYLQNNVVSSHLTPAT